MKSQNFDSNPVFVGANLCLKLLFPIVLLGSCAFVEVKNEPNFQAENKSSATLYEGSIKSNVESEFFPQSIKQNPESRNVIEFKVYEDSFPQDSFSLYWVG